MTLAARARGLGTAVSAVVLAAGLALLLVWPLAEGVRGAFVDGDGHFTWRYLAAVFQNPIYREGFVNALSVGVASTLCATALGLGVALLIDRADFPGKRWLRALVPLPLMVPPFVGALGIKQLVGREGAVNALLTHLGLMAADHPIDWLRAGRFPVVVGLTALHLYPIVYFNVSAALGGLNVEMEEAARGLGCRGWRLLWRVTLPSIHPSVFAATSLVFIWAFTELGVPLMCDYNRVTSVQIFLGLKDIAHNPFVHGLVVVTLVATVGLYAAARRLVGRRAPTGVAPGKGVRLRRPHRPSRPAQAGLTALLVVIVGVAALPNLSVVLLAFSRDWYASVLPSSLTLDHLRAAIGHPLVVPSIGNSLRYVALSTGFDLLAGTAIALFIVRSRSRVAALMDAAAMLPLAVPGLVMAFGYLAISQPGRPLAFLDPRRDPTALLVIAYAVRRLPFVVRSAVAGLGQIARAMEEAAASLGAGAVRTFARVTLPLLGPHLLAGGVFAFALSMLEVSDSLILAQREATHPITRAIYDLFQLLGDGRQLAAALGLWAMAFLIASVAFARSILGRKLGRIFRL
ncbi:MAG TPA: iron ABC transporter permease [Polyangia bacterium]